MFRKPTIFQSFSELTAAESTRQGGISPAPYHSLNLGKHTQDDPGNVQVNRQRFFRGLAIPLSQVADSYQVHGDQILKVDTPGSYKGYDALITNQDSVFLAVTAADCTPILIYDPIQKAVAAIHAGWRGTVAKIVQKVIEEMQQNYQTKASNCYAYIGTCIDECSFEVDADVADHFTEAHKKWEIDQQKYFVNLKAANENQLLAMGLPATQIEISTFSTVLNNETYYSYRKENGTTGRMLAVIGINAI